MERLSRRASFPWCSNYRNDTGGLYLLTTIALALGTMRLAKRHVLLHDMKSIEALARVDVLCVDKTGTITEAGMEVAKIVPAKDAENTFLQSLLRGLCVSSAG